MLDGEINIGRDHERERRMDDGRREGGRTSGVYIVRGVGRQDNDPRTRPPPVTAVHTIIRTVDGIWSTRSIPAADPSIHP